MNTLGICADCRRYRDMFCTSTASPYGGRVRLPVHGCWACEKASNISA